MVSLLLALGCALHDDATLLDSAVYDAVPAVETAALPPEAPREGCPLPVVYGPPAAPPAAVAPAPIDPAKVDAWIAGHGGLQYLGQHRMESGETAWAMSQAIGVPVWVLRGMNTHQDLDHLQIADWVVFPVTGANAESASAWYTEEECGC